MEGSREAHAQQRICDKAGRVIKKGVFWDRVITPKYTSDILELTPTKIAYVLHDSVKGLRYALQNKVDRAIAAFQDNRKEEGKSTEYNSYAQMLHPIVWADLESEP